MKLYGFYTLISRETYRFLRLANQTITPPLITTVMFILIFGYSLGAQIKEVAGFTYIQFILPGLMQMGVINNAYANTSTSIFMARIERSIQNLLIAPLNYFQMVTAYILGGVMRGAVVAGTILIASAFFVDMPHEHPGLIAVAIILTSVIFSGLGIISALLAESWEKIGMFTTFVLTPCIYLGGTFYSVGMLPPFWYKLSHVNPIYFCIDLMRYAFLGVADSPLSLSLPIVSAMAVIIYAACVYLFKRGYKLVS